MESSQDQPNPKRQRKNDESPDEPKVPLKIDDLNDFCLLNIFERLNPKCLSNVADTNKQLRLLAMDVYKRKFGAKTVGIHVHNPVPIQQNDIDKCGLTLWRGDIPIFGLKKCLQHLRNFGPYIHGLLINYNDANNKHCEYIHKYVNDFCAESLVGIRFRNCRSPLSKPVIAIEQFQKVFVNIRNVSLEDCDLGDKLPSFVRLFPNLRSLDFDGVRMVYRSIKKPFPNLEHLSINFFEQTIKLTADLLNGICQLKSLKINEHVVRITELLDLIKENPTITNLSAYFCNIIVDSLDIQRLISEHPALIELDLVYFSFKPDDVMALTRGLGSLKLFKFRAFIDYDSTEYLNFDSQLKDDGWHISERKKGSNRSTHFTIEKKSTK